MDVHQVLRSTPWVLNSPMKNGLPTTLCESDSQALMRVIVCASDKFAQPSFGYGCADVKSTYGDCWMATNGLPSSPPKPYLVPCPSRPASTMWFVSMPLMKLAM